ncbi:hypothetical protein HK405_011371, partial [Cladochytrium tenue]
MHNADQESRQLSKEWEIWVPALTAKNKMEAARREGALVRQEVAKQKATLDKLVNTLEDKSRETADMRVQQAAQVTRAEKLQELQENLTAAETQRNKLQEIYVWLKECERKGELGPIAAAQRSKLEEINERLAEDTPMQKLGAYESVLHYFGVMKWLFEVDKEYHDAARGWNALKGYQKIVEGYETQVAKLDLAHGRPDHAAYVVCGADSDKAAARLFASRLETALVAAGLRNPAVFLSERCLREGEGARSGITHSRVILYILSSALMDVFAADATLGATNTFLDEIEEGIIKNRAGDVTLIPIKLGSHAEGGTFKPFEPSEILATLSSANTKSSRGFEKQPIATTLEELLRADAINMDYKQIDRAVGDVAKVFLGAMHGSRSAWSMNSDYGRGRPTVGGMSTVLSSRLSSISSSFSSSLIVDHKPPAYSSVRPLGSTDEKMNWSKHVDVAFCVDCTGSMGPYIKGVKAKIEDISTKLQQSFKGSKFRFAFVGYRDFNDGGKAAYPFKDFISNTVEFGDFLATVKATSGDDTPEDVIGGLELVTGLGWH